MSTIGFPNLNQLSSTAGRRPRLNLGDALSLEIPGLYADRSFVQQTQANQRNAALQQQGLDLQAQAEQTREAQQSGANLVSGAGTVGQLGLAAVSNWDKLKSGYNWLTGAKDTATPAATTAEATGASLGQGVTAGEAAGASGEGALWGSTAATPATAEAGAAATNVLPAAAGAGEAAGAAGTGALGAAAGAGGSAAAGSAAGMLSAYTSSKLPISRAGQRAVGGIGGAAAGFGTGAAIGSIVPGVGTVIGGIIGGIAGGLGGSSVCVLHEAGYGKDSLEVAIARRWRDERLSKEQLRGYYHGYESVADRMHRDPAYRAQVRQQLTDRLVRYAAQQFRITYAPLKPGDRETAEAFLRHLSMLGKGMQTYTRRSGEVI